MNTLNKTHPHTSYHRHHVPHVHIAGKSLHEPHVVAIVDLCDNLHLRKELGQFLGSHDLSCVHHVLLELLRTVMEGGVIIHDDHSVRYRDPSLQPVINTEAGREKER